MQLTLRTLSVALDELAAEFSQAGITTPRADAELLAAHVLGESRGRVQALALLGADLVPEARERLRMLAEERADRVPLQHLTGRAPFRGIELSVGPGVFIPRPETEIVAEHALAVIEERGSATVIDLCTGSGALALAIAQERPETTVWAVEKSADAHAWAERNVAEWGDGRVQLLHGDIVELDPQAASQGKLRLTFASLVGHVDVLVSNPPYVPAAMVPRDAEVRDHDPALALFSGEDGLDLIRVISRIGQVYVRPGGALVLEHAETQGAAIRALLADDGWRFPETHPDLTGRDRVTTAQRE